MVKQMSKYYVAIEVVYTDVVEADSEDEAIDIVINNCPFDNDSGIEPVVELLEGEADDE